MKVYIVMTDNGAEKVFTNKEKAEAYAKNRTMAYYMTGGRGRAYIVEREVED